MRILRGDTPPRRGFAVAGLALLLGGATAGCGGELQSADLPPTLAGLVEQAKNEGAVSWMAAKPRAQMQPLIDLFQRKYPGIEVKYTETKAPNEASELNVQQAARRVSVDVVNAVGQTVVPSVPMADSIDWQAYGVAEDAVFEKNFVYSWAAPKVWAYNTTKVEPADIPKTWDDLLAPRWSGGRVAADSPAQFMTVWGLDPARTEAGALSWAKKFAAQTPHYTPTVNEAEALVESGQASIGTSLVNLVLQAKAKGAPVDIAPLSPTSASEAYLYVPKGAPHPAAGALLTSFLSSGEAQQTLAENYNSRVPDSTDCSDPGQSPALAAMCTAGLSWFPTPTLDYYRKLTTFFPEAQKALGTDIG
ncbi:ABC transporter substrate-binding protein [Amycolatopsis jiangsuensis]|uniref:Iron(III) transport system substrate-binding protein n=1 Tax=Amycolatopsis jiangsuensis TaxID=1181879 RepID=A0A840J5H1_9PSEU|nr:ABC transporter substrate-binding protein [Amycolatopsis jiangsuensis]MBB4689280.1 iron(III) transport system substrate-binding protein [Amycolatopsis jiangsuensis]